VSTIVESDGAGPVARYLALAEKVIVESERVAAGASAFLGSGYEMTERDRVLTGLACKAYGSFRALIEDCRAGRPEAMHHLKTMVEVFIYFYAVTADETDKTADGLVAERVAEQRARRLRRLDPGSPNLRVWEELRDEFRRESVRIDDLAKLAARHGTSTWYAHVYQLACESAHLADLLEWMPSDNGQIRIGENAIAEMGRWKVKTAIGYGIEIVLGLLETITQINIAGLRVDTSAFRAELAAIRDELQKEAQEGGC